MAIKTITPRSTGLVNVKPNWVYVNCTDSLADIVAPGFLTSYQQQYNFNDQNVFLVAYGDSGEHCGVFSPSFSDGIMTLESCFPHVLLPTVENDVAIFSNTYGSIASSGTLLSELVVNNLPQTISSTTALAAPGTIRAIKGLMTGTHTTMTSGNLVGVRGEVDCVGASGGFLYGVQGKIIPTGTLSGSVWTAAVFGQFDVSGATVNAGQLAAIWGDWGTTGATATDLTGCRGVAFTNTTSNVLNAQDYRYGNATYLLELAGAGGTLNYYAAAGTSAGSAGDAAKCAAQQVLKVYINSVAAYIPVFTQNT